MTESETDRVNDSDTLITETRKQTMLFVQFYVCRDLIIATKCTSFDKHIIYVHYSDLVPPPELPYNKHSGSKSVSQRT